MEVIRKSEGVGSDLSLEMINWMSTVQTWTNE